MSQRERLGAEELAIVLSYFDVGPIRSIKEFPRGSRRAPKLLVTAKNGQFLLKRRAKGKDDPFKVAFSHALQLYLASKQFPLPHLVGTRTDNNSMLQLNGHVYELFEFIRGGPYDASVEATADAGKILALYHRLLRDYTPEFDPPVGSYHDAIPINTGIDQIPVTFNRLEQLQNISQEQVNATLSFLRDAYIQAAVAVNEAGLREWPIQIVHSDWHPGNMLFLNRRVVAVIDYDAARLQQRVIDLANGALQFSIIGSAEEPQSWPDHVDEPRFVAFIRGYDDVDVISTAELQVIPHLMVEALVAESVLPIAATGSFGRIEGYGFLQMIERKVRWIKQRGAALVGDLTRGESGAVAG
ncbi:MAG TPA: phosphotransferase [Phycisphaerae bacterium]|nr:phosphotransferase [Phycisphaerae bacterium]